MTLNVAIYEFNESLSPIHFITVTTMEGPALLKVDAVGETEALLLATTLGQSVLPLL